MALFDATATGDRPTITFSLSQITGILNELLGQNFMLWASQQQYRAREIMVYRDYYAGQHTAYMTDEIRAMLRAARPGTQFNNNYMPLIVQAEADRLILDAIKAESSDDDATTGKIGAGAPLSRNTQELSPTDLAFPGRSPLSTGQGPEMMDDEDDALDPANDWAEHILDESNFDELQADVHEAALRDGDTYVMVVYDNDRQCPILVHELAYDTRAGIAIIYDTADDKKMLGAVKIWHISDKQGLSLTTRINIYLPGQIYKYVASSGSNPMPIADDAEGTWANDWTSNLTEQPIGVPIIHFKNRGLRNYGYSELRDCISHQDALNRLYYSMIINSELAAFPLRVARGFNPPAALTPGMWIVISGDTPLSPQETADVEVLPAGDFQQYLTQSDWVIEQMHRITQTPNPEFMGSDAGSSGEALKQREIGLLGKVRRAQVKLGSAWEHCLEVAAAVDDAFGIDAAPVNVRWNAVWADSQIRNDAVLVQNALAVADKVDDETFLRLVAPVFDWSESQIAQILAAKKAQGRDNLLAMATTMPTFQNYSPLVNANAQPPPPGVSAPVSAAPNTPAPAVPRPQTPTLPQKPQ